jgi:hypothetical protein
MKIRKGFVSNSSSSSFTCQLCDETWTGWDGDYGDDTRQMSCLNGHSFCNHCVSENLTVENLQKEIIESMDKEDQAKYSNNLEALQEFVNDGYGSIKEYLNDYDMSWSLPESFCPICRFEQLTSRDGLRYLIWKHQVSEKDILEDIKEHFDTYKRFDKYMQVMES